MSNGGTVYKRGDTWYVNASVAGSRVRKAAGKSRVDALRLLAELQRAERNPYGEVPLHAVMQGFAESLHRRKMKAGYIASVESHWRAIEAHFGPNFNACGFTPRVLEEFVAARLATGVGRGYVVAHLKILRSALYHAVDAEILDQLPIPPRGWKRIMPKIGRREPRILTQEQATLLISRARKPFDVILWIALRAGLRHQEILHLQVRDVDLGRRQIVVSAKPNARWSPKGHHERAVPLSPKLAEILEKHIADLDDQRPMAWLFPGYDGGPRTWVNDEIRQLFKDAGLYDREARPGLHMLRRTWATSCLAAGATLVDLMQMAGWANLEVAQGYLAGMQGLKRAVIDSLDR
jgi:integrase